MSETTIPDQYGFDDLTTTVWNWLEANPEQMREAKLRVSTAKGMPESEKSLMEMFDGGFFYTYKEMLQGTLFQLLLFQAYQSVAWKWIAFAIRSEARQLPKPDLMAQQQ